MLELDSASKELEQVVCVLDARIAVTAYTRAVQRDFHVARGILSLSLSLPPSFPFARQW